ncbi:hypothetical protein C8Q79DRAFT_672045 [Trametes meyenii]|nr:hypothetical protein C8Q79DRAFT_672045 [Trametes meyenii]
MERCSLLRLLFFELGHASLRPAYTAPSAARRELRDPQELRAALDDFSPPYVRVTPTRVGGLRCLVPSWRAGVALDAPADRC